MEYVTVTSAKMSKRLDVHFGFSVTIGYANHITWAIRS